MVWVSFLEPSHLFEREMIQNFILTGGKVGFHRNSLDHVSYIEGICALLNNNYLSIHQLFDDFALVRPTIVASTPRFWNLVYNQYLHVLSQEYKLYSKSISAQTDKLQDYNDNVIDRTGVSAFAECDDCNAIKCFDSQPIPEEVRKDAIKKISSILGGRQRLVSTGGAPTAPAVMEFLDECFHGLFHEGYGASEVKCYIHVPWQINFNSHCTCYVFKCCIY